MVGRAVAALVVASLFAGCLASSSTLTQESVGWKSGFQYTTSSTQSRVVHIATYENGQLRDEFRDDEGPQDRTETREVLATNVPFENETYDLVMHRRDERPPSLYAVRPTDLAEFPASTYAGRLHVYRYDTDGPVRFPMKVGDRWTYNGSLAGDDVIAAQAHVEKVVSVRGPNGPVDAFVVRHEYRLDQALLQGALKKKNMTGSASFEAEVVVHYAPSLHAVVSMEGEASSQLEFFKDEDGKEWRQEGTMSVSFRSSLTAISMKPLPELSLAEIQATLATGVRSAAVEQLPGGVELRISTPEAPVLEDGNPLALTVNVQASRLKGPITVTLHGEDSTEDSVQVPSYGGGAILAVDKPGTYSVVAQAIGADGPISAYAVVPVDARYTFEATCSAVGALQACSKLNIETHMNLDAAKFTVKRAPLVAEPGAGDLQVAHHGGASTERMLGANERTMTIEADGWAWNQWEFSYSPVGATGRITYVVELLAHHEPAPAPEGFWPQFRFV